MSLACVSLPVMDEQGLLAAVHAAVDLEQRVPLCEQMDHGLGHACLTVDDDVDPTALGKALSSRYGSPRNLAAGGYVDPTVTERTGAPLLTPFGDRLVAMRAWLYADRWIGCGAVRVDGDGDGDVRPVVLVAERAIPEPEGTREDPEEIPADTSWVDRVVAVRPRRAGGR